VRSETFGDHYSQARQFLVSQTPTEQDHIVNAFVFELGKCERLDIRERMVANLRNVDEDFARRIAAGLGLDSMPAATPPFRAPITDLPESPALSIVRNGPDSFAGRKVGVLVTDGTDGRALDALAAALSAEGALLELVAPTVGGITTKRGKRMAAHQSVDGGPSVLYDAVALLPSADGAAALAANAAAKDFVTDAHAHCKFIGRNEAAQALLDAAGLTDLVDAGYLTLDDGDATKFVETCRALRYWDREAAVTQKPLPQPAG
jgi:catalase